MSREIKFRAFVKPILRFANRQVGFMIDVSEIDFNEKYVANDDGTVYYFDEIELVQYTGLKDKNGVEIYEGDIVETVYNGEVFAGVVVYDLSEVDFKVTDGKEKYGRNFQYLAGNDENEVIGNIYENPELLEETK